MFELEGEQYSLEQVTSAAEQSNMSLEDYLKEYDVKKLEETVETVEKPKDVVEKDATVTSIEPEQASESMELEQVDTSLVSEDLKPKVRRGRAQVRQEELQRREIAKEQKNIENTLEEVELSDSVFTNLSSNEKIKLQDIAVDQIALDYKSQGVKEYDITPEEVDIKATEMLKEKNRPSVVKSYAAQGVRGFASFAKGLSEMGETIQYSLVETALDAFDPSYKGTVEEKQAIMGIVKGGGLQAPGSAKLPPSSEIGLFIEKLEPSIRKYEANTITEDIEKGNYLQAGERAVGAAIESLPSIFAAATGAGGLVLLGGSVSGGKFMEEFEADPEKSTGVLLANAGLTGVTEATFELVTRGILSKARLLKDSGADKAATDLIRGGAQKLVTALGLNSIKEGGSEAATKATTLLLDQLTLGKDIDWSKEVYNIVDEGIVGSVMGSGTTFVGAIANTDKAIVERAQMILTPSENKQQLVKSANNISKLYKDAKSADSDGVKLINEAIKAEELNIVKIKKETAEALNNMTPAELKVYANNQNKLRKLQQQALDPKTSESVKKLANDKFVQLRNENNVLFQESEKRRIQRGVEVITEAAEKVEGVEVQSFDTTQEVKDFIKQQDPEADLKASEQQGFIVQNPTTGEQTIVINKEVAGKEKAMNIAGHEFGHAILFKTVKDSPKTAENLGEALLSEINKIDAAQVKDSKFKKRLEQYSADPKSIQMEEAITLFSDALATGDIKFNENVFTKIGDQIRRVMQALGVKVKFDTGRDVYNFIKDYNKSIEKGKIGKAQIKAAKKGVKGALVQEATTEAETIVKESRSEEASQEVQKIYEEQGVAGAFEILEKFKPITNKLVERRSKAPNFDRQLLTDEIETGKRGIFDLIREYKPDSGVPLAAYINKYLPARAIEASNRVLGEEFTEDITEAKGVVAEAAPAEVVEESSSKSTSRDEGRVLEQIDVRKFGPAKDKVDEISSIVEVKEGERPTYKQLTDNFIEPVSMELFDVPGKKIQGKATLTDAEAKSLQRLFVSPDNVRKLIKTMPPYNVATSETVIGEQREIIDVSKDIKGRSIGLSNKFIKQFYQPVSRAIPGISSPKGRSLGETSQGQVYELKPEFKGRVSNDAVKQIQNSVGVTEAGVPNEKISAANRTKYGTTLTGFAKTYIANVINVTGRSKQTSKQEQADTGAGKSRVMFAKNSALQEGVDPKTLLSTKKSIKTLSTKQVNKKSDIIFNDTKALFLNNIGDVDSFLDNTVDYFKNIKLKDKDLQKNIRSIATASSTRGNLTEYYNWHKLDNNNTLKEALGIKRLIPKKWNSSNDIEAEFNDGAIEGIEVKMGWKDIMGSGGLFFDGKKVKSYTYNNGEPKVSDDIVNEINNNQEVIDMLLTATENAGKVESIVRDGKVGMPFTLLSETETQARSSRKELNRPKFKEISMSIDQVLNHYKKKDVGLFIIGDELFYVQDKRGKFKEMGIPRLNTDASIKLRVKTSGIKYRKTNKDFVDSYVLTGQYQFSKKPENGIKFSKVSAEDLDKTFNDILEKKTGIPSIKIYGIVEAITKGSSKGRFNFFIPPSAEDFVGLLYPTLGKGKIGDAQMSWYKKNLIDPYAEGMNKLSKARVYITNTYNQLKKQLDIVPKNLTKKVGETDYTKEQAVRVYIWRKQKMEVPGMSKKDVNMLADYVASNDKLQSFADQLINLQLGDGYAKPKVGWPAGTITTDILEGLNTTKRAKYLSKWQQNVDAIFSEDNLNKLQAAYGVNYRKALEGTLKRMKTGRNRNFEGDSTTGRFTDWLTGSVGAIMFFNTRSAVLQTISAANYINFEDNNIFAAGKAFANQKQYWSDFMKLINSDFLKERRGGLRMNVNEADISDMAKKGGVRGVISKLLELGFTPTQVADSFAIASGGSTFYRNRINTYKKQGLSVEQAEKKAFEDFRESTEESQQSSRADRISQQQASPLGRIVLAFANAPAQYARIIKKAVSDLKNGRGNPKANISRIIYYGAVQNLIFNALQQALFATAFRDEEPEDKEKEKKYIGIANGMLDSILRGSGIGGAIVSVGKNTLLKLVRELEKDRPKLQNVASELLKISPAVSAKYSRVVQAGKSYDWNKDEMREKGLSLDNPAFLAAGNVVSALTNIPLDRVVKKANNVVQATTQDLQTWERIGLLGGWQDWELGIKEEKPKKAPKSKKVIRKKVIKKKVTK